MTGKLAIAVLLAIAPLGAAHASDMIFVGKEATVTRAWIGCNKFDDYKRVLDLAVRQRDVDAAAMFSATHDCKPMRVDVVGLVEDTSGWSRAACLRQRGDPKCYWLPFGSLEQSR